MTARNKPFFEGGSNIAMKAPTYLFAETVDFYKAVLMLPLVSRDDQGHFSGKNTAIFSF
ncbi:MAG TPA: hypothetical protein P5526_02020 [Anaerolineae bacterium]|nr:hypothetical protein [Anaerolineae bacterium]